MLRNKLVRSDGSIIDSSVIISCEYTEEVNSNTNLSVGDITASELAVEILSTTPIQQGEVLTYYIIEDGVETLIGVFNAEKPTVATRTTMKFSAYDNVVKTEKQFSNWLRDNQSLFPMTLLQLVQHTCDHCGVALATTDFPHVGLSVNPFYSDDLTCRQILAWASAIAGRFVRANANGGIEFAWYRSDTNVKIAPSKHDLDSPISITDDGEGNLYVTSENLSVIDDGEGNITLLADGLVVTTNDTGVSLSGNIVVPFRRDCLSYESYSTDLIERVQINHSDDDVGIIYPAGATGNCFTISKNMILGTFTSDNVTLVANSLYNQLRDVTYVPFSATVARTIRVRAGDNVTVTDSDGNVFTSYVMKVSVTPSGTTLTTTGDKSYGSSAAVASEQYSNLTGKILAIKKDVDGLQVKNEALDGKMSGLELDVGKFKTYVEDTYVSGDDFSKYRTESEQTADGFKQRFEFIEGSIDDTKAHINYGRLDYNEDGTPIVGIEVGQRNVSKDGVETFYKYARFTSDRLSFYDSNDVEVAYVSDYKLVITNAEIRGSLKLGEYNIDTTDGLAFKHAGR